MTDETDSLELRSLEGVRRQAALAQARQSRLVVVSPAEIAQVVALDEHPLELGRERLGHGSVSRRHLQIAWQRGAHLASDAGSKNGSWLDGRPLTEARALADGAVLRLGGVVAVYEAGPAPHVAAIPASDPRLLDAVPGESYAAVRLREVIARAAPDPAPAVVLGETGVGKERVAQALHLLSRRGGPFVAVNVAELSDRLVESQLFGHVKGAFTGADAGQPGLFRSAHKGTLLLDEIGELPLELQAKLLRVIQEREVRPVGATRAETIDVRVVAATHLDLGHAVEAGRFRRDLWARLCLWELRVPPLSARRADILDFVRRLHQRWASERGRRPEPLEVEPDAAERLLLMPLPENLRALDRLVHRLDGGRPALTLELLADTFGAGEAAEVPPPVTVKASPPPTSAEELQRALDEHGSVHALARHYGKDRRQIYRWLEQFGLRSKG